MTTPDLSTKDKIVQAARTCLLGQGHSACTIKAVARAAGVNQGLVHHYFGSKEALMVAVLDDHVRNTARERDQAMQLGAVQQFLRARFLSSSDHQRMMIEMQALSAQMPHLRETMAANLRRMRMEMALQSFKGDQAMAALVMGCVMGLSLQSSVDADFPAEEVLEALMKVFGPMSNGGPTGNGGITGHGTRETL